MAFFTYLHNLDPFAITFNEGVGIRWYGLAYVMGFICSYYLITYLSKKSKISLSQADVSSLINYALLGVLLGGRLGYCVFYDPSLFLRFDSSFPFWGVLAIHKGGMASHGGILGVVIAFIFFARKNRISIMEILDIATVGGIGIVFGRIANFINGELYGRVIQSKALIGVQFPKEIYSWLYNWDQTKLLSLKSVLPSLNTIPSPFNASKTLLVSQNIWQAWVQSEQKFTAEIAAILRQMISSLEQGNLKVIEALQEVLPIRHPSQVYQALLEGLIPFLIIMFLWWKAPRTKGVIACTWAISYLLMRVTGEFFRAPDSHIGFEILNLTRGQWISLVLLIPTLMTLYYILSRKKQTT